MVSSRLDRRRFAGLAEASLTVALLTCGYPSAYAAPTPAEQTVEIVHQPLRCWPAQEHIVLSADVRPSGDIHKNSVYFRWDRHAAWYFVPMVLNAQGSWVAVLPKTLPETTGVVYFFESMSSSYMSTRSEEFRVPVRAPGQCEGAAAVIYTGASPNITLGATSGTPLAPGFQASGINAFISPTGVTSAVGGGGGGGVGGRTAALIGGAGGAAAFFAIRGRGDGAATTTLDAVGGITTTAGTTTTTSGGGPTSTTTTASGGGPNPGPSTTSVVGGSTTSVIAGSGTTTVLGPTTSVPGPTTTVPGPTTTVPGPTTTVPPTTVPPTTVPPTTVPPTTVPPTTVPPTTVPPTTVPPTTTVPAGCPAPGTARADASVSVAPANIGVTVGTPYNITIDVSNGGPDKACAVFADLTLPANTMWISNSGAVCALIGGAYRCNIGDIAAGGSGPTVTFTLIPTASGASIGVVALRLSTTDPVGGNNTDSFATNIPLKAPDVRVRFTSQLTTDGGTATGRIMLNGADTQTTDGPAPRVHTMRARNGDNVLEAYPGAHEALHGQWRFDFGAADHFVPGSLRVESGVALASGPSHVVFAVRPGSAPLRATFVLEAPGRRLP